MADQVFVFKRTVRGKAQRHNMYATFGQTYAKEPGSARIHQSILSLMTGNILSADDQPTPELMHYIAGLQRYAGLDQLLCAQCELLSAL